MTVLCDGQTALFFPPRGERPETRAKRVHEARQLCFRCPSQSECRALGRAGREYGIWGGETTEERARAGYGPSEMDSMMRRRAKPPAWLEREIARRLSVGMNVGLRMARTG